ncbi:MAG: hypothetical protein MHPSP_003065, partial [Paramarteilia canceri]
INIDDDNFKCNECEIGELALATDTDSSIKKCLETNCNSFQYYDESQNMCVNCNSTVENSIGRREGTPPLRQYCSCSNDSIKIISLSNGFECIPNNEDNEKINRANMKISDLEFKNGLHLFFSNNIGLDFYFYYCQSFDRPVLYEYYCMCNKGYMFYDGKCKTCKDIQEETNQMFTECPCLEGYEQTDSGCTEIQEETNQMFTEYPCLEGYEQTDSGCTEIQEETNQMFTEYPCLEGYEQTDSGCTQCPMGYFKDSAEYKKCTRCRFFYTTSNIGSTSQDSCSKLNINIVIGFVIGGITLISLVILGSVFVYIINMAAVDERITEKQMKNNIYENNHFFL